MFCILITEVHISHYYNGMSPSSVKKALSFTNEPTLYHLILFSGY